MLHRIQRQVLPIGGKPRIVSTLPCDLVPILAHPLTPFQLRPHFSAPLNSSHDLSQLLFFFASLPHLSSPLFSCSNSSQQISPLPSSSQLGSDLLVFSRRCFTLYTEKFSHTEVFTVVQRNSYTKKFLHRQAFKPSKLLHREALTKRHTYKEKLSFTQTDTDTQPMFTQRSFYAEKLLHKEVFTQRNFYT